MSYRVPRHVALLTILFKRCYPLYRFVYFTYKRLADRRVCAFLRDRLRRLDGQAAVLDIGANIGFYTNFIAKWGGGVVILSFEPAPTNLVRLRSEVSTFDHVRVIPCAVADKSGKLELTLSPDSSIDHHLGQAGEDGERVLVDAVAIDDVCADLPKVDIIKMDIQGAEVFALFGMKNLLARSPDCVIIMELWPYGLKRAGAHWRDLVAFFKDNNLTPRTFDGLDVEKWCEENGESQDAYINVIVER